MPGPYEGGVELTQAERDAIGSLARHLGESPALAATMESAIRSIARQEIASLAGMMMRRLQDEAPTRSPERNLAVELLQGLWGEALTDFGGTTSEPGP